MSKRRNPPSADFKAEVALAALRNDETMAEPATRFGFRPTMIKGPKPSLPRSAAETSSPFYPGYAFRIAGSDKL
jgi:transposase